MLEHIHRRRKSRRSPKVSETDSFLDSSPNIAEIPESPKQMLESDIVLPLHSEQGNQDEIEHLKQNNSSNKVEDALESFEIEHTRKSSFLVSASEVPRALRKTYLQHGYRSQFPRATFSQHFWSIFQIHTQTLNIWTALLSIILGLQYIFIPWLRRGFHYNPYLRKFTDVYPSTCYSLILMMLNTCFALFASLFYHWFGDYSLRAYAILNSFDTLLIYSTLFTCISHNIMEFEFLDLSTRFALHVLMMCFSLGTTIYMVHAAIKQVPRIINEKETKPTLETNKAWYYLLRVACAFGFACTTFLFRLSSFHTFLFFCGNTMGIYCFLTQFPDGFLGIDVAVGHAIWHCWAFIYVYACFAWLCADIESQLPT